MTAEIVTLLIFVIPLAVVVAVIIALSRK